MHQGEDGRPYLAGRGGNSGNTTFQSGNPLFEDIDSRLDPSWSGSKQGGKHAYIHDTAVDVAKLLEAKEPRPMGGIIEDERLGFS